MSDEFGACDETLETIGYEMELAFDDVFPLNGESEEEVKYCCCTARVAHSLGLMVSFFGNGMVIAAYGPSMLFLSD